MPPAQANRRYTPPKSAKGKEERVIERGGAPAAAGKASSLYQAVMSDPGVQQAQQKQQQKRAQDQAWDQGSWLDKLGFVAGKALQPLEYLNYPRRLIETGVLNLMENIPGAEPSDWGHIFKDPREIRAGRSNWELIQGESGDNGKGSLGFGDFIVNMPKGPEIPIIPDFVPLLPQVEIKPGEAANRAIGFTGDVGLDPFTRLSGSAGRVVNPAERALATASRAEAAGNTAVDDLARLLERGASPIEIEQTIGRTMEQVTAADKARRIAAETPEGLVRTELPRGRQARANFIAQVRAEQPEVYAQFKDELLKGGRRGFANISPEAKEALGITPSGIAVRSGIAGMGKDVLRIPGTGPIGAGASAAVGGLRAGLSAGVPALSRWRDPEGISQALDTLTRGKGGDVEAATARVHLENSRRIAEGMVRQQGGRQVRQFDREFLRGVRKEGRQAVAQMMHEAETVGGTPFNKIFGDVLDTYSKISGQTISPEFLLDVNTYVPHRMTQQFKRYLMANKDKNDQAVLDFERHAGGFLTEDLLDQAQSISYKRTFLPNTDVEIGNKVIHFDDGTIADLNEKLKQAFPKFQGKFYEDDPARLLESYVTSRAKEAGNRAGINQLADNPAFAQDVRRISGPLADELEARNAALRNDPMTQMLEKPFDPNASADYAQRYLEAPRGPTDEGLIGPRAPAAPARTRGQVRAQPELPDQWVDEADSIFRSIKDRKASYEQTNILRDQGDDWRQAANKADVEPDWRKAARTNQRQEVVDLRSQFRDLRQNAMYGLKNQPRIDRGPLKELSRQIKNAREGVRRWTLKASGTTAELETVINQTAIDIGNMEDELARLFDDTGGLVAATEDAVRKRLEGQLRDLRKLQAEAEEKLNTAPARMRAEARARSEALQKPVREARQALREAEERTLAAPTRRKVTNAQKVMQQKAGSTYDVDAARLAELDGMKNAANRVPKEFQAEYRTLRSKFTHRGEHGAEGRARKVIADAEAARGQGTDAIAQAQRNLDAAVQAAQVRHEAVVRGADQQVMLQRRMPGAGVEHPLEPQGAPVGEPYPAFDQQGNPVMEPGEVISGPSAGGDIHLADQSTGFGVGEERNVTPSQEGTKGQRAAAAQAEARRIQNEATGDTLPVHGRTEEQAIDDLLQEADIVEAGGDSPLRDAVDRAASTADQFGEQLRPGAISQQPEVVEAMAAVRAAADDIGARRAAAEAIKTAAEKQAMAAQLGVDQRIAQVQDLVGRREEMLARRQANIEIRRKTQDQLLNVGKRVRQSRQANLKELSKIFDDLEYIAFANPQLDDHAMLQVEQQLNNAADRLMRAEATQMTADQVGKLVKAAYNGKLAPVMRTGTAKGWSMLKDDTLLSVGDVVVRQELHDQMKNLYQLVDDPTAFGRAFSAATNLFKTYATLSPGFHVRNGLSAIFMNTADGVSLKAQAEGFNLWSRMSKATDPAWFDKQPAEVRQALEATIASGAGGRYGERGFAESEEGARRFWRWLNANRATRASQKAGEWVEGSVRLGMALDSIRRGDTVSEALERISRVHFDYSQISKVDQRARQFIPFWTYYSRNLPLQIQMMWTQPRAYSQFESLMSAAPPDAEYTPDYWQVPGNWNTGAVTPEGPLYGNLDLPFTRSAQQIQDVTDLLQGKPKGLLAQLNPWMAAPAELATNSDFFTGQQFSRTDPNDYNKVSGALGAPINVLAKIFGQQDPAGRTYEPFTNLIQSVLPMVDRTARLAPAVLDTGKNKTEPQAISWARFAGLPIRVLTPEMQKQQRASEYYDRKDQIAMQRAIQAYLAQQGAN